MPKIMLKNTTETKSETNNTLSLTKPVEKTKTTVDTLTLQRILRKKRELINSGMFLGILAKCYLGIPYEVHTLSFSFSIIEHYKKGQTLPDGMEKARAMAARGVYEYIEVYTDYCCAVSSDGTVSMI